MISRMGVGSHVTYAVAAWHSKTSKSLTMKTIIHLAFIVALVLVGQAAFAQENQQQTEEYAILSITLGDRRNVIRTTMGHGSTEEKIYKLEKTQEDLDMVPIIEEMERINKMGFELFSSSTTMITVAQGYSVLPYYVFVFKRKL
jgi:hypothetical protein